MVDLNQFTKQQLIKLLTDDKTPEQINELESKHDSKSTHQSSPQFSSIDTKAENQHNGELIGALMGHENANFHSLLAHEQKRATKLIAAVRESHQQQVTQVGNGNKMKTGGWAEHFVNTVASDKALHDRMPYMIAICHDATKKVRTDPDGKQEDMDAIDVASCNVACHHQQARIDELILEGSANPVSRSAIFPFENLHTKLLTKMPNVCDRAQVLITSLNVLPITSNGPVVDMPTKMSIIHSTRFGTEVFQPRDGPSADESDRVLENYLVLDDIPADGTPLLARPDSDELTSIIHNYAKIDYSGLLDGQRASRGAITYHDLPAPHAVTMDNSWDLFLATFFIPMAARGFIMVNAGDEGWINFWDEENKEVDQKAIDAFKERVASIELDAANEVARLKNITENKAKLEELQAESEELIGADDQSKKAELRKEMSAIRATLKGLKKPTQRSRQGQDICLHRGKTNTLLHALKKVFGLSGLHTFPNTRIKLKWSGARDVNKDPRISVRVTGVAICQPRYTFPKTNGRSKKKADNNGRSRNTEPEKTDNNNGRSKKKELCTFFLEDKCRKGKKCRFSHA
mgnify:CR=1 FL=1